MALSSPIIIADADKLQKFMKEMWKWTDILEKEFKREWTIHSIAQNTQTHAAACFKAKVRAIENFHASGGRSNTYASANAATELKDAVAAALDEFAAQNKENEVTVNEVKEVQEKIDTLQEGGAASEDRHLSRVPHTEETRTKGPPPPGCRGELGRGVLVVGRGREGAYLAA